ncbi:MAG: zf-HC2 domain-containing protein [Bryobacteraceae bacterium]|nr:zf-HC2 domain-containing protein [Bryobacteraceae bacterium]
MVTCKDFLRELGEYLDESTDPELRAELDRHINECPNCWVVLDTTKKTINIYKGLEAQPLPERLRARLMEAVAKKIGSASNGHDC